MVLAFLFIGILFIITVISIVLMIYSIKVLYIDKSWGVLATLAIVLLEFVMMLIGLLILVKIYIALGGT
ncbi:hypothetical protein [Mechercharimyces sp. CAU 1602]|uniref:hypothetical protein n=1 Tax=Mechercharimyces sp. CAU 1602 TaxID=2973933 RepID=UPI0021634957|nr:hypothetical protein [Mechercharimyces sp. CAU 1602]MCS1352452.1 hypothetical protein [Mechercharimyces sp. CAU 1602]